MNTATQKKLLALNESFYTQFADAFASTRENPQPGFDILRKHFPDSFHNLLDVGCGNGRFGKYLERYYSNFDYVGIDFTKDLLQIAAQNVNGIFLKRDITREGFLEGLGNFDVIVCISTMQHIPGRSNRIDFLLEIGAHLTERSIICLANWQFLDSPRQRRKIQNWEQIGLSHQDVEDNDYLLSWQREGFGLRYVCMIDAQETASLANEAGLIITHQFRSDGKEGNLNLYTILGKHQ